MTCTALRRKEKIVETEKQRFLAMQNITLQFTRFFFGGTRSLEPLFFGTDNS